MWSKGSQMAARQTKRIFDELSEKFLKCYVCGNPFDENEHVPVHYLCTHSACQDCVTRRFVSDSDNNLFNICPVCKHGYRYIAPTIPSFEHNYTLISIKNFISSKKICDRCSDQISELFCRNCDLNLCRTCSDETHVGRNLNHDMKFSIHERNVPVDACQICEKQSAIYCPTCNLFFCLPCGDVQHNDESVGTHVVHRINQYSIPPLAPEDERNLVMQKLKAFGISMKNAVYTTIEGYKRLISNIQVYLLYLLTFVTLKNALMISSLIILLIGMFMSSFPAYTILPFEEVKAVSLVCRRGKQEGVYQQEPPIKVKQHRNICSFNVFHHDFQNRRRTHLVVDINVEVGKKPYSVAGVLQRLLTIKLFDLNREHDIYIKQRSTYWSLFWCRTLAMELALCISKDDYERNVREEQKIISSVKIGQNFTVSFLFVVDNDRKTMEISSRAVDWKDEVLLHNYYRTQQLRVWFSLDDTKPDKGISARIRSGSNIIINDLPKEHVLTYLDHIIRLLLYQFRYLFHLVGVALS
ncbi:uncharacterized protein LOC117314829 [Pecten maximus]|uniref:uncharacterized protein LOC117314829 n=1 Tax=Pecten maximus TaxID=6579 RepID=UPI00145829B1|nr:uncharacterized protein LOC117314829 [Pecten maximus]